MNARMPLFISVFYFISLGTAAEANFVRYTDENGKMHYVNTEYNKIPEQYQDQVKGQLQAQNINSAASGTNPLNPYADQNVRNPGANNTPAPLTAQDRVAIYVKANCKECERLETVLQANQIKYLRYDVNTSIQGQEFYKTAENADLPITTIGSQMIPGNDIGSIKAALQPSAPSPGSGIPDNAPGIQAQMPAQNNNPYPSANNPQPGKFITVHHLLGNNNESGATTGNRPMNGNGNGNGYEK